MLGYISTDVDDMVYALDSVLTTINSDDDPWLYNNTWRAKELLQGLQVEGYFATVSHVDEDLTPDYEPVIKVTPQQLVKINTNPYN